MKTNPGIYITLAFVLLGLAYGVFRILVRNDYLRKGKLGTFSSCLQLGVFAGLMSFPYLFNPREWPWIWMLVGPTSYHQQLLGLAIIILGFIVAFGTMAWFGLRRAFGMEVKGLIHEGPYRFTRNPQILGGYLLVIGTTVQWPSLYSLGWIVMSGIATSEPAVDLLHWMLDSWSTESAYIWDLTAAVIATDERLCPAVLLALDVQVEPGPEQGRTVIVEGSPNAEVCLKPDIDQIKARLIQIFNE